MAGLRKEFSTPDGIKVAVDDVDVTFFSGQVRSFPRPAREAG